MAAIAYPVPPTPPAPVSRDHLGRRWTPPPVVPGSVPRAHRQRPGVYLRRRIAVAAAASVVAIGGLGVLARPAPAPVPERPALQLATGSEIVVHAGDTLWSLARRLQPTGDVRPLVDELVALNGGSALEPGDVVVVP